MPIKPQKTGATLRNPPKSSNRATPAAPLFKQAHEPEERRRRQAVVEHLQKDTV